MKEWLLERKFYVLACVLLIIGALYYVYGSSGAESAAISSLEKESVVFQNEEVTEGDNQPETAKAEKKVVETIMVDIKGQVKTPGVYPASVEQRVADIINQAGGITEEADVSQVNFAQHVQDEMVIYIPAKGEVVNSLPAAGGSVTGENGVGQDSGKLNINQADEAQLQTLPGIGPAKAAAIIEYRNTSGPFKSVEDLKNISGIGDKTFDKIKDLIDIH